MTRPLPDEDLAEIVDRARADLETLRGARVLVTGATGFFGTWLVGALLAADEALGLGLRVTGLARAPASLAERFVDAARRGALELRAADARAFAPAAAERWTHVIHAATAASARLNEADPREMFEVALHGTSRILDVAREHGARRVLLTSSGAVYGRQPPEVSHADESALRGPDPLDPTNAYAEGKRGAELLAAIAAQRGLAVSIARGFAFVGPLLPLDAHFAIGNFLRDGLAGGPIVIAGDGTPLRSYLYVTDLVEWLLAILVRGQGGRAYNVGSEHALSIAALADRVAAHFGVAVERRRTPEPGAAPARYVPSTARARGELGLSEHVGLDEAIARTARWHLHAERVKS